MSDVEEIADLFQDHRDELGFVNRAQVREKTTHTRAVDGDIVAAVLCNHCIRKPQTTIYEIAVDEHYRRNGYAESLIDEVYNESPHEKLIAKCPKPLSANEFYRETGWALIDTEDGKNRDLNVWRYTDD